MKSHNSDYLTRASKVPDDVEMQNDERHANSHVCGANNYLVNDTRAVIDLTESEGICTISDSPESGTMEIWIPDDDDSQGTLLGPNILHNLGVVDNNSSIDRHGHSHIRPSNLFHRNIIPLELFTHHPTALPALQRRSNPSTPEIILQQARITDTHSGRNRVINQRISRMSSRNRENSIYTSDSHYVANYYGNNNDRGSRSRSTRIISYLFEHEYDTLGDPTRVLEHENFLDDNISDALISDYDALWELADTLGYVKHQGADTLHISSIPITLYSFHNDNSSLDMRKCSICLYEFNIGDKMKRMPLCLHIFHSECLDKWLQINATCPICRVHLLEPKKNEDNRDDNKEIDTIVIT